MSAGRFHPRLSAPLPMLVVGLSFLYCAVTAAIPARILGEAWQRRIHQVCAVSRACVKVDLVPINIGPFQGYAVGVTAQPGQTAAVMAVFVDAIGPAARLITRLQVDEATQGKAK